MNIVNYVSSWQYFASMAVSVAGAADFCYVGKILSRTVIRTYTYIGRAVGVYRDEYVEGMVNIS